MIPWVCWETARVQDVFTTESRQKQRDLFLQTHRPFRRIRVDFCKEGIAAESFITESDLRRLVEAGHLEDDNRLFFVVGEAGSGKSELCQWLEYTADPNRHIAVHIPRSQTSAVQVAHLVRERLGEGVPLRRTPLVRQIEHIMLSLLILLYERPTALPGGPDAWEQFLSSDLFRTQLSHALHSEPQALLSDFFEDAQIASWSELYGLPFSSDIGCQLRSLLEQCVTQSLWLGNLRQTLTDLSTIAVARGKRPLLLIEDITAFQAMGDLLLDYLLDLSSGHWDAVIGVTSGHERTQLTQAARMEDLTHIHHRLRARLTLTDESGRAYGLEEDLIAMTRTYLAAVKPNCTICSIRQSCDDSFGAGLYPFTEIALYRAFEALEEEGNPRQTPRLFLEQVLATTLLSADLPPVTLDRSPFLRRPPFLFRTSDVADKNLQSLLRWYGAVQAEDVTLPQAIANRWDVPFPDELCQDDHLTVPRSYTARLAESSSFDDQWADELRDLQAWLTSAQPYPRRETLKQGIEKTLLQLGDPRTLGNRHALSVESAHITYARGDERLPIYLGNHSGDLPGDRGFLKIQIEPTPESHSILEEIVYLALSGSEVSRTFQNIAYTMEWAQGHWDAYQNAIHRHLSGLLKGLSADELILGTWQLLMAMTGQTREGCPPLPQWDLLTDTYATISPWSKARHPACYSAGEKLLHWHSSVRRLFIGSFMLRDTLLDRVRYEQVVSLLDDSQWLHSLVTLHLPSLRSMPYKVRPGNESLYALLVPLQHYVRALLSLNLAEELEFDLDDIGTRIHHVRAQTGLDLGALRAEIGTLQWRCGTMGVAWLERWERPLSSLTTLKEDDINQLAVSLSEVAHQGQVLRNSLDIWNYQNFRHDLMPLLNHPYWEGLAVLREVLQVLKKAGIQQFRKEGRLLTHTEAYRRLLKTARAILQEVKYD